VDFSRKLIVSIHSESLEGAIISVHFQAVTVSGHRILKKISHLAHFLLTGFPEVIIKAAMLAPQG